ncbi:TRAP-type C4-dicarboxylate transport system permease small subunit [Neorhizobium galegae]|uniref:TRAP transporter small permease n=1 Tax=Neorhizobium galegae TaxID=399 RepID=UPI001AE76DB5|nr:TRAP transporter small permease [Neorhizobium galegae]MBP2551458.1 TRAP-type C4-dicarboxylate transport system permease small subunit [Neorhizobium galegae]
MHIFLKISDGLSRFGAIFAGISLAALVLMDGAEVLLRTFFSSSLSFVVEYNGYLLAAVLLGGCGQAIREGGHIRVAMLPQALGKGAARGLDIGCTIVGIALAGYLCSALAMLAVGSFRYGTVSFYASGTPLGYPQAATAAMLGIFVISLLARLIRLLAGLEPELRPDSAETGAGAH